MGVLADQVVRVFELGDKHDFEGMAEAQADDCELTMPGVEIKGRAQAEGYYRSCGRPFPMAGTRS